VKRFRGGLVFEAHRLKCHSTLGLRVIKKAFDSTILYYSRAASLPRSAPPTTSANLPRERERVCVCVCEREREREREKESDGGGGRTRNAVAYLRPGAEREREREGVRFNPLEARQAATLHIGFSSLYRSRAGVVTLLTDIRLVTLLTDIRQSAPPPRESALGCIFFVY